MSDAGDVLVVGSGAGAVHAAWPLVAAGLRVTLVDYGNRDERYAPLIPERPWSELRRGDPEQHRYFLGDEFEGVDVGEVRVGAQLTPPRAFLAADTERLLPVDSTTFQVTQSLARGGLAAGWGAGVFPFDDQDLPGTPFTRSTLRSHEEAVAERIGVAGARDDLLDDLGDCAAMLPPLELDSAAERVLERYQQQRERLNARGFRLGRTRIAACSVEHRGRGPHPYLDMDFWADARRSVYRAGWTLDELEQRPNFTHVDRRLVLSFHEDERGVEVVCTRAEDPHGGDQERHRARALVLGAGALGSARIALRSFDRHGARVPVLCNPYTYAPVVNTGMLGRTPRDRRHSLAQLTAIDRGAPRASEPTPPPVVAQYYSYRSLLLFKLVKEAPLAHREALKLMRLLAPVLGIVGIHHADEPSPDKWCALERGAGGAPDRLVVSYRLDEETERRQHARERDLLRTFRRLGCWTLKRIRPGHGANIHYAGTLPYSERDDPLTTDRDGRLRGTRAVYVADGAVFPALPAKGLTFTLMANADRVGTALARRLT